MIRVELRPMQDETYPTTYAEKIVDLLAPLPFASAEAALKISHTLLEYQIKVGVSAGPKILPTPEGAAR